MTIVVVDQRRPRCVENSQITQERHHHYFERCSLGTCFFEIVLSLASVSEVLNFTPRYFDLPHSSLRLPVRVRAAVNASFAAKVRRARNAEAGVAYLPLLWNLPRHQPDHQAVRWRTRGGRWGRQHSFRQNWKCARQVRATDLRSQLL